MAYESKMEPGRKFQNHQEGKHFDSVRGEEAKSKKKTAKPKKESESEGENEPMHEVVAKHGPATESKVMKSDGADTYEMHSEHEDGHHHESKGHTMQEAHNESMMAHGGEGMGGGEEEGEEGGEPMPMVGHHSMPPGM